MDDREWNEILDEYLNPADYEDPGEDAPAMDDDDEEERAPDHRVYKRNRRKYKKFRLKEGKKFR